MAVSKSAGFDSTDLKKHVKLQSNLNCVVKICSRTKVEQKNFFENVCIIQSNLLC